jgi:ferredoxin
MFNLFRTRTYAAAVTLFAGLLLTGFLVQRLQKDDTTAYEGTYPGIRAPIPVRAEFAADAVTLFLEGPVSTRQIVVFAYDEQGRQYGTLKSVRDGAVKITGADYPEYLAYFRGTAVDGYKIFRRVNGKADVEDFLSLLRAADAGGLRFGVQQCMYPVCTRCLEVCPVISKGVIQMNQTESGAIVPTVLFGSCPRSGRCFAVCTLGAFYKASLRHIQTNPPNLTRLETVIYPRVIQ